MIHRRRFLAQTAAAATVSRLAAQSDAGWGAPVLDIHFHFRPRPEANLAHLDGAGVSRAVMLTPVAAADRAKSVAEKYPGRFLHFTSADVTRPETIGLLTRSVQNGSRGFGEIKLHLALDSPEMRRLYALAAELRVPVLLHFEDAASLDASYNSGFSRFPAILKGWPKTTFIGHANSFWANISADVPTGVATPPARSGPADSPTKCSATSPISMLTSRLTRATMASTAIPILPADSWPATRTS